ncbi:hypothetical protein VCHA56P521_110052 [Vibrio chagasii]|nr:hypothetical protein VCHA34O109_100160 [Vibrio chagasii]CAH6804912.1 hypothetical protein VCHA29O37_110065 [Vibrio chagasii]CAH6807101.1 hypothetical protein VCHA36P164_110139 [Vibrio chagasii]CAH6890883.1 hypothetical protein VCHA41O249_100051 [Vibrio chagasii]CAH6895019.1 hypothetical protein VCHA43P272_100127 [Vibrio chagasii]
MLRLANSSSLELSNYSLENKNIKNASITLAFLYSTYSNLSLLRQ